MRRRGNVKFVRARAITSPSSKGKEKEGTREERGGTVKGMYEGIVSSLPVQKRARKKSTAPIIDLTLSDSSSDSDDDIIILDPLTDLPLSLSPPLRRPKHPLAQGRPISALLPSPSLPSPSLPPFIPPIQYSLKPSNIGWKILALQGWKEGSGLGASTLAFHSQGEGCLVESNEVDEGGLKVPLRGVERAARRGLGAGEAVRVRRDGKRGEGGRKEEVETEREREGRERGERDARERKERKMMLGYMNR